MCVIECGVAVIPTVVHAAKAPQEETWQTFGLATFAAAITAVSLMDSFVFAELAYPVYLLAANATITSVIIIMRIRKGIGLTRRPATE